MANKIKSNQEDEKARKLDFIVALLLDMAPEVTPSMAAKARRLADFGFSPAQAGRILGRPANYISAILGRLNRKTGG